MREPARNVQAFFVTFYSCKNLEILDLKISRINASFIYLFDHEEKTWYIWNHSAGKWNELMDVWHWFDERFSTGLG